MDRAMCRLRSLKIHACIRVRESRTDLVRLHILTNIPICTNTYTNGQKTCIRVLSIIHLYIFALTLTHTCLSYSIQEFEKRLGHDPAYSPHLRSLFNELDTDSNGKVSYIEFMEVVKLDLILGNPWYYT